MKFDVVIGTVSTETHPQHKFLPTIIQKLEKQNVGDIYVCEDGHRPLIKEALKPFKVKHFTHDKTEFTLAKNLNRGLLATTRPTIVIMGDSIPKEDLLKAYERVYEPDRILTGVRYYKNTIDGEIVDKDWRLDMLSEIDTMYVPWRRFTGNNWCASPKLLKDLKGWNEDFKGYGFEDFDFALRAYDKGYRFTPVLDAIVYHINHPKIGENENNQLRWFDVEQEFYNKRGLKIKQGGGVYEDSD